MPSLAPVGGKACFTKVDTVLVQKSFQWPRTGTVLPSGKRSCSCTAPFAEFDDLVARIYKRCVSSVGPREQNNRHDAGRDLSPLCEGASARLRTAENTSPSTSPHFSFIQWRPLNTYSCFPADVAFRPDGGKQRKNIVSV